MPGPALASHKDVLHPVAGCSLWRNDAGNFAHVGDGPRGWITPVTLSSDGNSIVIPCRENAALIDLTTSQELITLMPFEGRLRASCILPDQVLMLNSAGRLFVSYRAASPEQGADDGGGHVGTSE